MDRISRIIGWPRRYKNYLFKATVPILYYHRVQDHIPPKLGVSPQRFHYQMEYLRKKNFSSVSFDDLHDHIISGRPLPSKPFIVSFDDGYSDVYEHAFPILKKFGYTATIFVVTESIGKRSEWEGSRESRNAPLVTRENILTMSKEGFRFGSHSRTHRSLPSLSAEAISEEVEKSREDLENIVQKPVRSFSYPYGDFNGSIIDTVKGAGYTTARGVHAGNIHFAKDLLILRCVKVNGLTRQAKFAFHLSRFYHLEQVWQERRKRRKEERGGYFSWKSEKRTGAYQADRIMP